MTNKNRSKSNTASVFLLGLFIPLIGYLGTLEVVQDAIQEFIGKKNPASESQLWFEPVVYGMLPGLVIGGIGGLFGVLIGLLPSVFVVGENSEKNFNILSVLTLVLFLGLVVLGGVASFYGQPKAAVFGFINGGLIALIVFGIIRSVVKAVVWT